ncbi:hypothetical protein BGY98DRAFT_973811 [Russula aff. rugulosa BPL654]|nr:hypothetical protein BGY98DRAFT_973811 [Russula aff. rugulosa BPL654]
MAEYDGDFGPCTSRNFDDIYLAKLNTSPRKRKSTGKDDANLGTRASGVGLVPS